MHRFIFMAILAVALMGIHNIVIPTTVVGSTSSGVNIEVQLKPTNYNTVNYNASTDGFQLSYTEWIPNFYNHSKAYPLIVFLHGQQDTSGKWFKGGLTNSLVQAITIGTGNDQKTANATVNAVRAHGAILIAVNSRAGAGWYVNSPCGGPQEQDTMDAIAHEKVLRSIGKTYLFGMSMGTEGTLRLAGLYPGMFAGVGIIAPVTDLFEDVAYRESLVANNTTQTWPAASIDAKAHDFCGVLPGNGNASQQALIPVYETMSPLRFNPTAFAGVPIYVTTGGADDRAPNNPRYWSYLNINDTFQNGTCSYAPDLGEPQTCSDSMESYHQGNSSLYTFRVVYERKAMHSFSQLSPNDMLNFWFGSLPGGFYTGGYPFTGGTAIKVNTGLVY